MKKPILLVIVVVLVGAGAGLFYGKHTRAKGAPQMQLYGNVDIREVNLGFRVGGKIAAVLKDEGDAVKRGEIIARLDDEPCQREVEEARGQVASLQARVALLESGSRPQEIEQARAIVRERQVTFENAQRVYQRQEELLATKAVSTQERDDAHAKYREAEARLKSAQEQLKLLEAGFRPEEISQARADLQRAEASLSAAELRLQDTTLKSPSEGVLLTRAQEPGAVVPAGATVATLSLATPVWVRAYVQEPDLGRVFPGMKVNVYTDSHPEKAYLGQVGYISPQAEFTPKNVETTELRTSLVYRLRIVIANPDEGLRQGMPVTVKVPLEPGTARSKFAPAKTKNGAFESRGSVWSARYARAFGSGALPDAGNDRRGEAAGRAHRRRVAPRSAAFPAASSGDILVPGTRWKIVNVKRQ